MPFTGYLPQGDILPPCYVTCSSGTERYFLSSHPPHPRTDVSDTTSVPLDQDQGQDNLGQYHTQQREFSPWGFEKSLPALPLLLDLSTLKKETKTEIINTCKRHIK